MDDPHSPASKQIAWSWIIEYLATSGDLVDWLTLRDLVVLNPDLGNNAGEVVALRILERLCDPAKVFKSGGLLPSDQKDFQFDSCESLVQVLEHVMEQATLTELMKDGSSTLTTSDLLVKKVHAFIEGRKTSLPKCFLEQLRDRKQKGAIRPIDVENGELPHGKRCEHNGGGAIVSEQYLAPNGVELSEDASRIDVPSAEGEVHEFAQEVRMEGRESRILSDANEQNGKPAQCTAPQICQQSEVPADCTQLDACIKCEEGGKVLTCTASSCLIAVHEGCLGFRVRFDSKGDFLCPVCAYSRALSELRVAKKELSLFSANPCLTQLDKTKVLSKVNGHPPKRGRDVDNSVKATSAQTTSKDKEPAVPAIPSEDALSKQKGADPVDRASEDQQQEGQSVAGNADTTPDCSSKEGEEENLAVKKRQCMEETQKMQPEHCDDLPVHGSNPKEQLHGPSNNASCAGSGDITGTSEANKFTPKPSRKCSSPQAWQKMQIEHYDDAGLQGSNPKGQLHGPTNNASCAASGDRTGTSEANKFKPKPSRKRTRLQARQEVADLKDTFGASHSDSDGTSEKESCRATPKHYRMNQGKGISSYDFNPTPSPEKQPRIKHAWTKEEEEKLKEGFERFGHSQWKAILEFGRLVFWKGRTTVDLKDKWRNLKKKYPELLLLEQRYSARCPV